MVVNDGSSLPLFNKLTLTNTVFVVVVVFTLIIVVAKSEETFLF